MIKLMRMSPFLMHVKCLLFLCMLNVSFQSMHMKSIVTIFFDFDVHFSSHSEIKMPHQLFTVDSHTHAHIFFFSVLFILLTDIEYGNSIFVSVNFSKHFFSFFLKKELNNKSKKKKNTH